MKVLISCYACSPFHGSEPGMGWNFVFHLAQYHDLWVLVEQEKWRVEIERYQAEHPEHLQRVTFIFIHKPRSRWLRKIWPPSYYWFYKVWQWRAYKKAKELHASIGFDLAHQLNMVTFREPGYLWRLPIPFMWGPVGGYGITPWRMFPALGWKGMVHYAGRNILNLIHSYCLLCPRMAVRKAGNNVIAATKANKQWLSRLYNVNAIVVCEVGLCMANERNISARDLSTPLCLVWSGQHDARKTLPLLIQALSVLPSSMNIRIDVLGNGSETASWKKLAVRKKVADKLKWHGWLRREEACAIMKSAHGFVLTSIHDLTSTVLLEAISFGLPVIGLDHLGFSDVMTDSCALRIPVTTPCEVSKKIAEAISRLYNDEPLRLQLASGAFHRSREFSWEAKVAILNRMYHEAMYKCDLL